MSGKRDLSGYNYAAISSLVLTADRSALPRRDKEPDGAPTSLAGRIDPREMGSRVQREVPFVYCGENGTMWMSLKTPANELEDNWHQASG